MGPELVYRPNSALQLMQRMLPLMAGLEVAEVPVFKRRFVAGELAGVAARRVARGLMIG
jgi:hypothetical protein